MRRLTLFFLLAMFTLASVPSAQQSGVLKAAADALGVANIKTLQFTGSGAAYQLGQNYTANDVWPPVMVKSYAAFINYDTASMRQEQLRDQGVPQPRGGGAAFSGAEQRLIQVVSGDYAWNVPVPAPAPAGGAPAAAAAAGGPAGGGGRGPAAPPQPAAAPANQLERMLMLWATPQGFIKAAMANTATTRRGAGGTEVSFTIGGKYKMTVLINARNP